MIKFTMYKLKIVSKLLINIINQFKTKQKKWHQQ